MRHCDHSKVVHLRFLDGKTVEWCEHCGAIRTVEDMTMKSGRGPVISPWQIPVLANLEWEAATMAKEAR